MKPVKSQDCSDFYMSARFPCKHGLGTLLTKINAREIKAPGRFFTYRQSVSLENKRIIILELNKNQIKENKRLYQPARDRRPGSIMYIAYFSFSPVSISYAWRYLSIVLSTISCGRVQSLSGFAFSQSRANCLSKDGWP